MSLVCKCGTPAVWTNHKLVCPKTSCPNYNKEVK